MNLYDHIATAQKATEGQTQITEALNSLEQVTFALGYAQRRLEESKKKPVEEPIPSMGAVPFPN